VERPSSVLFACTLNALRSPMAEAITKFLYGHRIYVDSCGVRGEPLDPFAVIILDEIGIDLSRHRAKSFHQLEDTSFDLIVSLSPEAQHTAVEMTRTMACSVEFWNTFDASLVEGSRDVRLAAYREVRDSLMRRIRARFAVLGPPQV
jgi:protein-tyrosine-phosphatase